MNRKAYYRECVNVLHQSHRPKRRFNQFRFNLLNGMTISFKGFFRPDAWDAGIARQTLTFTPGRYFNPLEDLQVVDAITGEPIDVSQMDYGNEDDDDEAAHQS